MDKVNKKIIWLLIFGVILVGSFFIVKNILAADLININTANLEELDSLPGIGPGKAQDIIDYRTMNGPFKVIDDIMNVKYIGQVTFDKIKDLITVDSTNGGEQTSEVKIVINEILPNPVGSDSTEWIELKNIGAKNVDLADWQIGDLTKSYTIAQDDFNSTIITAGGFFILERIITKIALNNSGGETVSLYNNQGNLIDVVSYTETAKENTSWVRDEQGNYGWTISLTPASENIITSLPDDSSDSSSSSSASDISGGTKKTRYEDIIILNEIMVNPLGIDDDEWIELYNTSKDSVSLLGWKIKDNTTEFEITDVFLKAHEIVILSKNKTGLILNNIGGDELKLVDQYGNHVDKLSYKKKVNEEEDYSWCQELNKWVWGLVATKGTNNICPPKNKKPVAYFEMTTGVKLINDYVWLDASESYDKDKAGYLVEYDWTFEKKVWFMGQETTEIILKDPRLEIKFLKTGKQEIKLKVVDDLAGEDEYKLETVVDRDLNNIDLSKIYLNQFLPNPVGPDNTGEWVEICSKLEEEVVLTGFILDDQAGGSKSFNLDNYMLPAEGCLKIFRTESNLALNNNQDSVRLFAGEKLIDEVNYEEAIEGYVYQRTAEKKWQWLFYIENHNQPVVDYVLALNNLSEVNNVEPGILVTVTGQVATEPGLLGKTIFYIIDHTGGVQIYSYRKDFPLLTVGDLVKVTGIMSDYQTEARIKINNKMDIVNLGPTEMVAPINIQIEDIGEDFEGSLIKIRGELTDKKGSTWWLDDKTDEVKIYIKQNTQINGTDLVVGDSLAITGIVGAYQGKYRILPRTPNDVKLMGRVLGKTINLTNNNLTKVTINVWFKYILVILIAVIIVLVSIIIKKKDKELH